jgi:CBS domain-containing protein
MNAPISSLMSSPVWTVDLDDTIAKVERLLRENGLSWAPVVEGGSKVVGVISSSDLLHFHAQQRDAAAVRAWELCSYKPLIFDEATPVTEVARAMVEQRLHHVVVTGRAGLAGVVSSLDFVKTFVDKL